MQYFEFVCSRNEGRSPVAELIAQWHLEKRGLTDKYGARSSGSHRLEPGVDEIQSTPDANVSFEILEKLILVAVNQGLFSDAENHYVETALKTKNVTVLKPFYIRSNTFFKDQERHFRSDTVHRLVEEKGLRGYLKVYSEQTVPRADTIAIFAMAPNNTEKVREIYAGSAFTPLIETLSAYALKDSTAMLPNAFAQGEAFYHDVINQLWEHVPQAIDRFLNKY